MDSRHWSEAPDVSGFVTGAQRAFFNVAAAGCSLGVLVALVLPPPQVDPRGLAAGFGILALLALAATQLPRRWLRAALVAFVIADSTALAAVAFAFHGGAGDAALGLFGVLLCAVCAAAGRRAGLAVAAWQLLLLIAVHLGLWPTLELPSASLTVRFVLHLVGLTIGLAAGLLMGQAIARHMRVAAEREQRFRRLLGLAADLYWETGAGHDLVQIADPEGDSPEPGLSAVVGTPLWELPGLVADAEVLDRLRADFEAQEPLRNVQLQWPGGDGRMRQYLLSGAPRLDERGEFLGYWGVARDITEAQAARAALAATEGRYRELFDLSPAPLVVHRGGRVIDANPAALAMFGHETLAEMLDTDLLGAFEEGASRRRARARLVELSMQGVGHALPVADFRLRVGPRRISVRATSVNVEAEGGPATLDIYADDTERLAAEEAVRRSEALLSHLVATTPDLVAVSELASGRFTMVNPAFERLIGWSAEEVVGRTSLELGTWADPGERAAFAQRLREHGVVNNENMRYRTRTGEPLPLLVSAARFVMNQAEFIVVIARDVSESERTRQEREAILANAPVGIAVTRNGQFLIANRHFETIFGWAGGEMAGRAVEVVWATQEDFERVVTQYRPYVEAGEQVQFETPFLRKDGSTFLGLARVSPVDERNRDDGSILWIVEDITERRAGELALHRARTEAEAASRAKSTFLANTSHELRTPLNAIVGLAALASDPGLDSALRQSHLEQIVHSARALAAIISDILDLSKIEAGRLELETSRFDLVQLLQSLHGAWEPLARSRGLRLSLQIDDALASAVQGDALRLRQIVGNLLSNALKFTAQGTVALCAAPGEREGDVRIEVRDSGPGIEPAVRERLFKPFTQADESTTRRYGGTGLGLSISHELAVLMGGCVGVQSRPGAGSCFWVEVPLPHAEPAEPAAEAALPPAGANLSGLRVLMVEDNTVNMLIGVAMLENWGVVVEQASDGEEALQCLRGALAEQRLPHAVLMDVQMPVMSGHEATRVLRATPGLENLPVVALTAAALVGEREAALAAGMNDFLTKPIDPERLRATLLRWCRRVDAADATS
jgi:PAS domain S-box-containing protein